VEFEVGRLLGGLLDARFLVPFGDIVVDRLGELMGGGRRAGLGGRVGGECRVTGEAATKMAGSGEAFSTSCGEQKSGEAAPDG